MSATEPPQDDASVVTDARNTRRSCHPHVLGFLVLLLHGCHSGMRDGTDGPVGLEPAPWRSTLDFIVTEMTFHVPEGLEASPDEVPNTCGLDTFTDNTSYQPLLLDGLEVRGFDLDGQDGDDLCAHEDFTHPDGSSGIDYAFLHVMDMIRPARPGQTIEIVLDSAPAQGLVRIGLRVAGVDDLVQDDEVEVLVTTTLDTPVLGTDGEILEGNSVTADPNPAFQSRFPGKIVDGVLIAGPTDITIGAIDLLVIEDREVSLRDAHIRATLTEREYGGYDVEATIGGWWYRDDMVEAISHAILTIGSNDGELDCVLDQYADHSTDGVHCDAMSTMLHMTAVSGFITGLDDNDGG